jgi:nitrogen fixation protein NifX
MLKLAFASDDRARVNLHFGAATAFVVYEVDPDKAILSGLAEFPEEAMDGNENKLAAKMEFLADCDAVFVHAIGASAILQLLARGVQPIRVGEISDIAELLREVRAALRENGAEGRVPWITRALATRALDTYIRESHPLLARALAAKAKASDDPNSESRFARMEAEGWEG